MVIKSAYPLKSFATMKEAQAYAKKIKQGAGKHAESDLEIHWNKKNHKKVGLKGAGALGSFAQGTGIEGDEIDDTLQWMVVVINEDPIPGGTECAECTATHFEDDYLCPDCREALS